MPFVVQVGIRKQRTAPKQYFYSGMGLKFTVVGTYVVEVEPKTLLYRVQGWVALIVWETISKFVVINFAVEVRPYQRSSFNSQVRVNHAVEIITPRRLC